MLIPWQDLSPETLENLIESFVLREGTDYGEHERTLEQKVADVQTPATVRRSGAGMVGAARNGQYHAAQSVSRITCNRRRTR